MSIIKSSFDIGDIEINVCSCVQEGQILNTNHLSNHHFHQYIECLYTEKGYFDINTKSGTYRINEGELCIIPKMLNHSTCGFSENAFRTGFMFYMKPKKKGFPMLFDKYNKLFSSGELLKFKASDELAGYFRICSNLHRSVSESEIIKIIHLYSLIIISVSEELEIIPGIISYAVDKKGNDDNERTYYIENYIYENYMQDICLKKLAEELHICERQINRILISNTGHTFSEILFQQRMLAARELILEPDIKIIDVPEKIGFKSYSGFYTSFKKFWGITPNEMKMYYGK